MSEIEVKALEWREDWGGSLDDIPEWRAKTPWGSVTVSVAGHRDENGRPYERHSDVPEELKTRLIAERQSDYEARIRSALVERKAEPDYDAIKKRALIAADAEYACGPEETAFNRAINSAVEWGFMELAALSASPSPVDSRDELIERLVKALEPFARAGDNGRGSALPDDAPLAIVNANMPDLPAWLSKVRGVITQGNIREARAALADKEQETER